MPSVLPLEIYELILDFVAIYRRTFHAKRTLMSTSLVCRALHPRSRALLFRTLRFIESDADRLIRYRCRFAVAPDLASYVEEVRLTHGGQLEHSALLELFPSCLAAYLPRLRRVFINASRVSLDMHRFFCLPGIRVPTVMTLEFDDLPLRTTSELDGLLLPYPNIYVLTLHKVWWEDFTDELPSGKGLPRPLKVPLTNLTELRLTHVGDGPNVIQIVNRLGYEHLLETCGRMISTLLLNIIPIRVLVLQFQDDHPLNAIQMPLLDVLHLEIFVQPGIKTEVYDRLDGRVVPYADIVTLIPRLLLRLIAKKLRFLHLYFSSSDIDQSPDTFLDHLATIRHPLEEMIRTSRFPNLKAITFDLGHRDPKDLPSWQSRIAQCFPELEPLGYIQVKPHDNMSEEIRREVLFFYH